MCSHGLEDFRGTVKGGTYRSQSTLRLLSRIQRAFSPTLVEYLDVNENTCMPSWSVAQQLVDSAQLHWHRHLFDPHCPPLPSTTPSDPWRAPKRVKITKRNPHRYESIQSGTLDTLHHLHR